MQSGNICRPAPKKTRRKAPPVSTLVPQRAGFFLDGQPFQIRSGEMHFARIPRPYWR
jgi:beta-galactosidase